MALLILTSFHIFELLDQEQRISGKAAKAVIFINFTRSKIYKNKGCFKLLHSLSKVCRNVKLMFLWKNKLQCHSKNQNLNMPRSKCHFLKKGSPCRPHLFCWPCSQSSKGWATSGPYGLLYYTHRFSQHHFSFSHCASAAETLFKFK